MKQDGAKSKTHSAQVGFWLQCEVEITETLIQPARYLAPYDPMERYRRGDHVHFKFARLVQCLDLSKTSKRQIKQFVREYGLPTEGPRPLEPYPLVTFFAHVMELRDAVSLWRTLQSRKAGKILDTLEKMNVFFPRPGEVRVAGAFNFKTGEFETGRQVIRADDIKTTPLEFGRQHLALMVNEHLADVHLRLLFTKPKPRHLWFAKDLLAAMWLMLALDILKEAQVFVCARCGDPYQQKRSTRMYCSRDCAVAEAQGRPRKRMDETKVKQLFASLQRPELLQ